MSRRSGGTELDDAPGRTYRRGMPILAAAALLFLVTLLVPGSAAQAASEPQSPVRVLHSFFQFFDSKQPINLTKGRDGLFYGETIGDGITDFGSIFKVSPDGAFQLLHKFHDPMLEADFPLGPLVEAADGNFYGTTVGGGSFRQGVAFRMTPAGEVTILHEFGSSRLDGANPWAGLIQAKDGYLYGTTMAGGLNGAGVIYRMSYSGEISILHDFALNLPGGVEPGQAVPPAPGARSPANLVEGRDGQLYGVTAPNSVLCYNNGPCGVGDYGTIFRITKNGKYDVLYRFPAPSKFDSTSGYMAVAPLMQASDGNFYGTTQNGSGVNAGGTVFRMTPAGKVTFIHRFNSIPKGEPGVPAGTGPVNPMLEGSDGLLYSTVSSCQDGLDCLYRINPGTGSFEILYNFPTTEAMSPSALVQGNDGRLYASAQGGGLLPGGASAEGTVFSIEVPNSPNSNISSLSKATTGAVATGDGPPRSRLCELSAAIFCPSK